MARYAHLSRERLFDAVEAVPVMVLKPGGRRLSSHISSMLR